MRWVKLTLPPRARLRWLLMTVRWSQSSLTGMLRTDVAVGTVSETSMFLAVARGMPLRTVYDGPSSVVLCAGRGASLGTGVALPLAGSATLSLTGRGLATGAGAGVATAAGAWAGA